MNPDGSFYFCVRPVPIRFKRRLSAILPGATLTVLLFAAPALADAQGPDPGIMITSTNTAEPGDTIMLSGRDLSHPPNTAWRARLSPEMNCRFGIVLGGAVNSDAQKNIAPVARVIPTNITSGMRWLCWHRPSDDRRSAAAPITIL